MGHRVCSESTSAVTTPELLTCRGKTTRSTARDSSLTEASHIAVTDCFERGKAIQAFSHYYERIFYAQVSHLYSYSC